MLASTIIKVMHKTYYLLSTMTRKTVMTKFNYAFQGYGLCIVTWKGTLAGA